MLRVNNIEVVYSRMILALKGMSLHIPEGKIVALLGSNGAGKSTTLNQFRVYFPEMVDKSVMVLLNFKEKKLTI